MFVRHLAVCAAFLVGAVPLCGRAAYGDPQELSFTQSPYGTMVANLTNVPSGCIFDFETTLVAANSHFDIKSVPNRGICGIPPAKVTTLHFDLGSQPPGHYTADWLTPGFNGPSIASAAFDVAPPSAAYVTPVCPYEACIRTVPTEATDIEPTVLGISIDTGNFPYCSEVLNPTVSVSGSVIEVHGTPTHRPGCHVGTLPQPGHSFLAPLPALAAGVYTVVAKLEQSIDAPTLVYTAGGPVTAGIIIVADITIHSATDISIVNVIEYYYPPFDHYFITADPSEIMLLDAHQPPFQDWERTGLSFKAYRTGFGPTSTSPVCRFFNDSFAPKSSHFFAAKGLGCEQTLASFPDWKLESEEAFRMNIPAANGGCGDTNFFAAVYRVYNNGMGGAPNHRFTTSLETRQNMIDQGWVPEGNGIGVAFCSPK